MKYKASFLVLASVLSFVTPVSAQAASGQTFKVVYGASLLGLPVGSLEITTTLRDRLYEMRAVGKVSGLAGIFSNGKGEAVVAGTLKSPANGDVAKSRFDASVGLGASKKIVRIDTTGGNVTALAVEPPMDDKPGRVMVRDEHKRAVVDPLTAVLMPFRGNAGLVPAECNRTIPVFDGGSRLNLVMSYSGTRQADIGGYKGPVLVCNVRYVPLAGHRPDRRVIKYMMDNKDISVWLAPLSGTPYLAPLRVQLKTVVGPASLEAKQWTLQEENVK